MTIKNITWPSIQYLEYVNFYQSLRREAKLRSSIVRRKVSKNSKEEVISQERLTETFFPDLFHVA